MRKKIDLEKYKELRVSSEKLYDSVGSIYCPALKADIDFTRRGFHHLRYNGSLHERDKGVQMTKFKLLRYAPGIIKLSTTVQEYRMSRIPMGKRDKGGFRKTSVVEWFSFFAITSFSEKYRIKVIVRRVGGEDGKFHFWSVIPYWTLSDGGRNIGKKEIEDK